MISPLSRKGNARSRGNSIDELRGLLSSGLTVASICEELFCFGEDEDALKAKTKLEEYGFDLAGIRDKQTGSVVGWVEGKKLSKGTCADCMNRLNGSDIVSSSLPLEDLLHRLSEVRFFFVVMNYGISSIVTRADMHKNPMRLLILGYISLLEMHLTSCVTKYYPDASWKEHIEKKHVDDAKKIFKRLRERNENGSLEECLSFRDKLELSRKSKDLRLLFELDQDDADDNMIDSIVDLRNDVAHANRCFVGRGGWPKISLAVQTISKMIMKSEARM